jgi:RNA polymerase sigma factor (sigma-70 family)
VVSGTYAIRYLRKRGDKEVLCEECYEEAIASRDEETASEIEKIMDDMPPKEKLVIELNLFHDKKYREIADMLDMPLATVSSHIKRAKAKLKISLTNL